MNIAATAFASGSVSAGPTPLMPAYPNHVNTVAEGIGFDSVPAVYNITTTSNTDFRRTLNEVVQKNIETALIGKETYEEKNRALDQFIEDSLARIDLLLNE